MTDTRIEDTRDGSTATARAVGEAAPMGLRERNRIQRERAIRLTGLRLFAERGYDETAISDIAEAAGVAPRTVSLYFPAKLDIALGSITEIIAELIPALESRPPDVPGVEVLETWLQSVLPRLDHEAMLLTDAAFLRNPALRGVAAARIQPDLDRIVGRLTDDLDGPHREFVAGIVVQAAAAIVAWLLTHAPAKDPDVVITLVVRFLRGGIVALRAPLPAGSPGTG